MALCLGIETSCDDTGLALVSEGHLVDSLLASQADAHAVFGGVVPELASREHERCLGPMFDTLLQRNGLEPAELDVIAVARGPGLLGSLLTGIAFAKGLALTLQKPLIGVNHLHAHLLAAGLEQELPYPALGLVISGGHTEIYRIEGPASFVRLGRCLDDAAGEAFDKAGKCAGLDYPAGKRIDELARSGNPDAIPMTVPYLHNENLDFSFSGLKTEAIRKAWELGLDKGENRKKLPDFCAALNCAVAAAIEKKVERALARQKSINTLYVAGGVAANSRIRDQLDKLMRRLGGRLIAPSIPLCMDNGAMIAYAGQLLAQAGFSHSLELEAIPRGRKIPDDMMRK